MCGEIYRYKDNWFFADIQGFIYLFLNFKIIYFYHYFLKLAHLELDQLTEDDGVSDEGEDSDIDDDDDEIFDDYFPFF
jgi:hypothetical protein